MNLFGQLVGLHEREINPTQRLYLHRTTQHTKTRTHIHASSGIRTHNPSARAVEDSTCLRQLGHWNRVQCGYKYLKKTITDIFSWNSMRTTLWLVLPRHDLAGWLAQTWDRGGKSVVEEQWHPHPQNDPNYISQRNCPPSTIPTWRPWVMKNRYSTYGVY
jgi:hypothetical protein